MTDSSATTTIDSNYVEANLPPSIVEKLEAGAFRSLCTHLKERSDEVQNMDLMTISGFCRNCLAKWMVMEARNLSGEHDKQQQQALDALGYDEAAQYVYGCDYGDWKKKHAKKASDEQMQKYNHSKPLHSVFDKKMLATKAEKPASPLFTKEASALVTSSGAAAAAKPSLLSNVCCQDVDDETPAHPPVVSQPSAAKKARRLPPFLPPPPPSGGMQLTVAIVTVSDRAFKNEYESGDLSGPAVQQAVRETVDKMNSASSNNIKSTVTCTVNDIFIVPDDINQIQAKLKELANSTDGIDLILTTGGTGFAARDVTPEATLAIVDRECSGLMAFVTTECSKDQPLASLSRGTAGVLGTTMVCNLPGNPKGVVEIIPILLPLVVYGIRDLQTL
jgi:molybdopterin adenylyltransferase